jgi:hypothetical protein
MDLVSILKKMFVKNMAFEKFRLDVLNHMQDSEVLSGKKQIDRFWKGKIDEFNAFLASHPDYQRLQELKQALQKNANQGEIKRSYELEIGRESLSLDEMDKFNQEIDKYNLQVRLRKEVEKIRNRICDDSSVNGVAFIDYNKSIDRFKYLSFESFDNMFGGEVFEEEIREKLEIPYSYFFKKIPRIESKICEQITSVANGLSRKQLSQLTRSVMSYLGDDFKAIYLCPAWAPSNIEMRSKGEWVYLDMIDLPEEGFVEDFYRINPRTRFVQHDLRDPNLPFPNSSFDFVYYNLDYAGDGVTDKVAEKLVKPEGIVMAFKESNPTDHTSLLHLGSYEFYGYQLLTKMAK